MSCEHILWLSNKKTPHDIMSYVILSGSLNTYNPEIIFPGYNKRYTIVLTPTIYLSCWTSIETRFRCVYIKLKLTLRWNFIQLTGYQSFFSMWHDWLCDRRKLVFLVITNAQYFIETKMHFYPPFFFKYLPKQLHNVQ